MRKERTIFPPPPQNERCVCPVVTTCSPTFDGTFSLERQHCWFSAGEKNRKKTRLTRWKRERPKKKSLNKRLNEEADSRRVEEEENILGRHIRREWSPERAEGGRKEEEQGRR